MGFYVNGFFNDLDKIFNGVADLIRYAFADKEEREYIKKVPHFCRIECDKIHECRNPNNNYKTFFLKFS